MVLFKRAGGERHQPDTHRAARAAGRRGIVLRNRVEQPGSDVQQRSHAIGRTNATELATADWNWPIRDHSNAGNGGIQLRPASDNKPDTACSLANGRQRCDGIKRSMDVH